MGDVISGVFGSGGKTTQGQAPDPVTQQLNLMKLQQAERLFNSGDFSEFGRASNAYTPSVDVGRLYQQAAGNRPDVDLANTMTLDDYLTNFQGATAANLGGGILGNAASLNASLGDIGGTYQDALNLTEGNFQEGLARSNANFNRNYGLGMDELSNYISQVASPEIMQGLAMQGQERSGAAPEAIAKATASVGLPFVQNLINAYTAEQGGLTQADMAQQAGLAQGNIAQRAGAYNQYGQNVANLLGQYGQGQAAFYAGLPGMAEQITLTPERAYASRAATNVADAQRAATLFPLADYSRQLQQDDLLRRQGMYQTAFTGLPYTPGSRTTQRTETNDIFENMFSGFGGNLFG